MRWRSTSCNEPRSTSNEVAHIGTQGLSPPGSRLQLNLGDGYVAELRCGPPTSRAGRWMIASTRSNAAPTETPTSRNGRLTSQTNGQAMRASSARGHETTRSNSQATSFNMQSPFKSCPASVSRGLRTGYQVSPSFHPEFGCCVSRRPGLRAAHIGMSRIGAQNTRAPRSVVRPAQFSAPLRLRPHRQQQDHDGTQIPRAKRSLVAFSMAPAHRLHPSPRPIYRSHT